MLFKFVLTFVILAFSFIVFVYSIYLWAIKWGRHFHATGWLQSPRPISIIIPAHNEANVIEEKIKNLSEIDYPNEMMEVIIIDDCSHDETREKAINAFKKYQINGRVHTNKTRQGTNANYNIGFSLARHELVITTDADVVFEKDALRYLLNVLIEEEQTGAVCAELIPWSSEKTLSTGIETPYRDVFGKICSWESHLHSTYCFNGPLIGIKKSAITAISPTKGASDTNIALMAIKQGFHAKYVPEAKFYEWIPVKHGEQKKQKIRRATRLLESTWSARSCLFKPKFGKFGMVVLPLRYAMLFFIPPLSLSSLIFIIALGFLITPFWGIMLFVGFILLFVIARWFNNIFSSFIWHQYYLFMGLLHMAKPAYLWESIDRKNAANPLIKDESDKGAGGLN